MKRAPRSRQRHDLYAKYHDYDSEISDLLGECGINNLPGKISTFASLKPGAKYWLRNIIARKGRFDRESKTFSLEST